MRNPPLTIQQEQDVSRVLRARNNYVVADHFNIEMTSAQIQCLKSLSWLNDEVINYYMQLLQARTNHHRCFFSNTFFYDKLMQRGRYSHDNVARWSLRAGIKVIDMDMVFVPIHVNGNHWCMACINFTRQRFEYYDSLGGRNTECLHNLRQYVIDEAKLYSHADIDLSQWVFYMPGTQVPQQNNGSDCGVFACKFADYLCDNIQLVFTQADMPYFRKRMVLEIKSKKCLT
jgi:sentrin-specific protease 1